MHEIAQAIANLLRRGERAALATVVRVGGSTPQQVGARLLLHGDGRALGTVGGGQVEQAVLASLARCLQSGVAQTLTWDLARDLGMCCGGRMEILVEPLEGMPRLILFGAGHVAFATAPLAQRVGFRVAVADEREELNSAHRFVGCARLVAPPGEALRELAPTADDWMLVVTHDHHLDQRALEAVLSGPHRYVGMVGSRRKALRVMARLRTRHEGLDLSRVFAPVGLALGALGPDEIAVSIVAELVALRRGRPVPHMRYVDWSPATVGVP